MKNLFFILFCSTFCCHYGYSQTANSTGKFAKSESAVSTNSVTATNDSQGTVSSNKKTAVAETKNTEIKAKPEEVVTPAGTAAPTSSLRKPD